ncbi:MAG: hypothetical protein OFPI_39900 [Osedax symbiont Rs2]|nr:MAG: hypothetical protein OFPI_39900 [Osedax symbiont Rs2]
MYPPYIAVKKILHFYPKITTQLNSDIDQIKHNTLTLSFKSIASNMNTSLV